MAPPQTMAPPQPIAPPQAMALLQPMAPPQAAFPPPSPPAGNADSLLLVSAVGPPSPPELPPENVPTPTPTDATASCPRTVLTLQQAIDTAFAQQPRLRVYLESVEQARNSEDVAFAPFLPMAAAGYSVGGFGLNVGGTLPGFTFLPLEGALPFGVNVTTEYQLAEVKLQWLICDFGRRSGTYNQAGLATDIAELESQRAYQTVAKEVAVAYYQVLRTRALRKTAEDSVHRSDDDLQVARKLARGGAIEKEKALRAEVQLAESQRLLDSATGQEAIAIAALNLAIGLNVNAPTDVVENAAAPPFNRSLADCLQAAVESRREFQVARKSIQVAEEGTQVAKADFAPRILAEGDAVDFQQASPRGHADLEVGFIKLEWGLFEGGKRVADVHIADSKTRAAMSQADSIADTIAFQVTEAYRNLITAQRGIEHSRPAIAQADENYRLIRARAQQGDATSAEISDAEATATRAHEDYLNSIHDFLTALVQLDYAMGLTPTPVCPPGER